MTEKEVAGQCDDMAMAMGWVVERYEQPRETMITEGIPDRRYVRKGVSMLWVELKKSGGQMTEAQYWWMKTELAGGGFATVIDDVQTLVPLLRLAKSQSSIDRSVLRLKCDELLELCKLRGWRPDKTKRGHRGGKPTTKRGGKDTSLKASGKL